jgi:hypothetical protein
MNHREAASAFLRITLGAVFLFNGIGKLLGRVGIFVGGMNQRSPGHFQGCFTKTSADGKE